MRVNPHLAHDNFDICSPEATWGADPLENFGGFRSLEFDENAEFPTSLAPQGSIRWSKQTGVPRKIGQHSVSLDLRFEFPEIDWKWLQSIYGWAAFQYQAWVRGDIIVNGDVDRTVIIYTDSILEYRVDDVSYFGGDFYALRRAPIVLKMGPGPHRIDLRLVRDVRSKGGVNEPVMDVTLKCDLSIGSLAFTEKGVIAADVVNGKLASPFASLLLRNESQKWINIREVKSDKVSGLHRLFS